MGKRETIYNLFLLFLLLIVSTSGLLLLCFQIFLLNKLKIIRIINKKIGTKK